MSLNVRTAILGRVRVREVLALALGVSASLLLIRFVDNFYPIKSWLIWSLLALWGWQLFLSAACASFGHLVIVRILRLGDLPALETIALSFPVGVVCFVMAMYAGGGLALYGPAFAVALPAALLAAGLPSAAPAVRAHFDAPKTPLGVGAFLTTLFGVLCLALLYLELMTPDALNYDSTWYHLVVAEDYAREGRIVPFLANWNKALPHLTGLINTWGFTVPGLNPPLRWMMALHTEFAFFLWTLVGVAAAVRWICDERHVRGAWVAYFLFPGIFVYDGNLGGSADHILALFAPALFIAAVRAARNFEIGPSILLGMMMAGAILTKYQAAYSLVAIGALLIGRLTWLLFLRLPHCEAAGKWRTILLGIGAIAASAVAFSSPHFIESWVYYRNPVYPLAQSIFKNSTPAMPGAAEMIEFLLKDHNWHPPEALWPRLRSAAELLFTFSFKPHYSFVRNMPCVGFLFTLVFPLLFIIPKNRRLWVGYLTAAVAVYAWAVTYWVDRNLQTFLPLLVAAVGAVIVRLWDLGWMARLGLVPLLGLQVAWGGDFMFTGSDRLQSSVSLIRSGFDGHAAERFSQYRREYIELGNAMPKGAIALLHNFHLSLGIDRTIYLDWIGFQGLIDYRTLRTPRDAYDRFAQVGVTHIIYLPGSRTAASKQEEVIFDAFAVLFAKPIGRFGSFELLQMPNVGPPLQNSFRVLTLSIGNYSNGIYPIQALGTCEEMPADRQVYPAPEVAVTDPSLVVGFLGEVDAVLVSTSTALTDATRMVLDREFRLVTRYDNRFAVYVRLPTSG